MRIGILGAALALASAGQAAASSPVAWEEFRADVRKQCLHRAQRLGMKSPKVVVHPVGTQNYGIAVLIEGNDKRICLYNKQQKTVELTPGT
ncbi:hypothetical protein [Phenylobacterium sp.]|uniref:hypothetical protein n=1 Tax=Phenylobacterium sp. TaxID=1871053 RepID=UPI002FDFABC5